MMRSVFAVLAVLLCFVAAGCGNKTVDPKPPTTGIITIRTIPPRATIVVDLETRGMTPSKVVVPEGQHRVELTLTGYVPVSKTVSVKAGGTVPIDTVLTRMPTNLGLLAVLSTPSGASIFLGGNATGRVTPETLRVLAGLYFVELRLDGFKPATATVRITAGNLATLSLALVSSTSGSLHVTSNPSNASVFIDGDSTGKRTPFTDDSLPSGVHTILLRLSGYADWQERVTIAPNTDIYRHAELVTLTGRLDVFSDPTGATVLLDGVAKGETPQSFLLPIGEHALTLTKIWYEPWSDTVLIEANVTQTVTQTLQLKPSFLRLNSSPSGAQLFVDGTAWPQRTPFEVQIDSGWHTIRLMLDGFFPWDTLVRAVPGETITTLLPIELTPSPTGLIAYTLNDSVWTIEPDGTNNTFIRANFAGVPDGVAWSPQGNYLAVDLVENGEERVEIRRRDGSVVRNYGPPSTGRTNDFDWYEDEQYLLHGAYLAGIHRVPTDPFQPIISLFGSSGYEHGPSLCPGDSLYAFVYNEWGYTGWVFIGDADSAGQVWAATPIMRTEYDEDFQLEWLDLRTLLMQFVGQGVYTLDVSHFRDSVNSPVRVVTDNVTMLRVSADKRTFAYRRGYDQIMIGSTGSFATSLLAEGFNGLHDFQFVPGDAGIICHTGNGILYIDFGSRKKYTIVRGTNLVNGAVSMTR